MYGAPDLGMKIDEVEKAIRTALAADKAHPKHRLDAAIRFTADKLVYGSERAAEEAIRRGIDTGVAPWIRKLQNAAERTVRIDVTAQAIQIRIGETEGAREKPRCAPSASVHETASLAPNVRVGENSTIERKARVGGGCTIGDNVHIGHEAALNGITHVGDGVVIEPETRIEMEGKRLTRPIECVGADGSRHELSGGRIPPNTQCRERDKEPTRPMDKLFIQPADVDGVQITRSGGSRREPLQLRIDAEHVIVNTDGDVHVVLASELPGSITRLGSGNGNVVRSGGGSGSARRDGAGDGDVVRQGTGRGDATRNGSGWGNAVRDDDGAGDAIREGTGLGNATRAGNGAGNAWRSGRGTGTAQHEGSGAGDAFGDLNANRSSK